MNLKAIHADITTLAMDAIVNAANATLHGGGGVDGAIHRAAGPELADACQRLGGCRTGEARITRGFRLPAKFVIHTVGPVWEGGKNGEAELLTSCYQQSLELADRYKLATIAFPAIGTGIYGYPVGAAAKIAITTTKAYMEKAEWLQEVYFCCFSQRDFALYQKLLKPNKSRPS